MEDPHPEFDGLARAWNACERALLIVLLAVAVALGAIWAWRAFAWQSQLMPEPMAPGAWLEDDSRLDAAGRLDPNTADWQALACLPNIGETKGKAIVAYRESHGGGPVFFQPDDLQAIHGIGPTIARDLAPLLRFPPRPTPATAPASAPAL